MFKAKQFLNDNNISFIQKRNWFHIDCPFCHGSGKYLGFNESGGVHCWKCGKHSLFQVVTEISDMKWAYIKTTYLDFSRRKIEADKTDKIIEKCVLPKNSVKLISEHKKYLTERRFDPDYLESKYGIFSTTLLGHLSNRIMIPMYYNNKIVSYTARSVIEDDIRYISCKPKNELRPIKNCLYGEEFVKGDKIVIVEGVTDQWRMGDNSVATMGTEVTSTQIQLLTKYKKVFILFDVDTEKVSDELASKLCCLTEVEIINLPPNIDDPDNLDDEDAKNIMKDLLKKD